MKRVSFAGGTGLFSNQIVAELPAANGIPALTFCVASTSNIVVKLHGIITAMLRLTDDRA